MLITACTLTWKKYEDLYNTISFNYRCVVVCNSKLNTRQYFKIIHNTHLYVQKDRISHSYAIGSRIMSILNATYIYNIKNRDFSRSQLNDIICICNKGRVRVWRSTSSAWSDFAIKVRPWVEGSSGSVTIGISVNRSAISSRVCKSPGQSVPTGDIDH